MRIAIVGSRDYPNMDKVRGIFALIPPGGNTTIITTGAIGVDRTVYEHALSNGMKTKVYRSGSRADQAMKIALNCDEMIVFWDGTCQETRLFIDRGLQCGVLSKVYRPS